MDIEFFGATGEVTGSCYLLRVGKVRVLLECGLIQGTAQHERHNHDPFPFDPAQIDAVILSHAHLDHSGRLPLLIKRGFNGPIYTHRATVDLCAIMLEDAGYLNEKEAEWENRKRQRKGQELVQPLYTREQARAAQAHFQALEYAEPRDILPGIKLTLHDAGHILGSAIVDLQLSAGGNSRRLVFSGDLGHKGAPILRDPAFIRQADLVIMESTYGDRHHRSWDETWQELGEVVSNAASGKGNILIPAFTVGRTQEILYSFKQHFDTWGLADWQIFLDSPMAIEATRIYDRHARVYDDSATEIRNQSGGLFDLPNLHLSRSSDYSMRINRISSGAIIIAGSGMCSGGRIKHHLKHNIWRQHCHLLMVGFQAAGTLGRSLVDGASNIQLWGESIMVKAAVHTIGGLSAHADQAGLLEWYAQFAKHPRVVLVHGEPRAMQALSDKIQQQYGAEVIVAGYRQKLGL